MTLIRGVVTSIKLMQVHDLIDAADVAPWTDEHYQCMGELALTEDAQDRVLHIPNTPPEVRAHEFACGIGRSLLTP